MNKEIIALMGLVLVNLISLTGWFISVRVECDKDWHRMFRSVTVTSSLVTFLMGLLVFLR